MTVGLSPKVIAAVVSAVVTYLITQTVLELPPGIVIAAQAVLIGVAAYLANPGEVVTDAGVPSDDVLLRSKTARENIAGQSLVGVLIAILLACLAYWLCVVLGLPTIIGIIAAIVVLLAAIPLGSSRW